MNCGLGQAELVEGETALSPIEKFRLYAERIHLQSEDVEYIEKLMIQHAELAEDQRNEVALELERSQERLTASFEREAKLQEGRNALLLSVAQHEMRADEARRGWDLENDHRHRVEADLEESKRMHAEAFRVGCEWQEAAKATLADCNKAEARVRALETELASWKEYLSIEGRVGPTIRAAHCEDVDAVLKSPNAE